LITNDRGAGAVNEAISHGTRVVDLEAGRGLEELEGIIARGLATFIEVGRALLEIQSRRLYLQAGYRSFAVYVTERWDLSEAHAYRQIEAAKVIDILSPIGETSLPANEAQARELAPLVTDPDAVRAVWAEIGATGERVTARVIRGRVAQRLGRVSKKQDRSSATSDCVCPACGHRWPARGIGDST
jgi:hypothetical protein